MEFLYPFFCMEQLFFVAREKANALTNILVLLILKSEHFFCLFSCENTNSFLLVQIFEPWPYPPLQIIVNYSHIVFVIVLTSVTARFILASQKTHNRNTCIIENVISSKEQIYKLIFCSLTIAKIYLVQLSFLHLYIQAANEFIGPILPIEIRQSGNTGSGKIF